MTRPSTLPVVVIGAGTLLAAAATGWWLRRALRPPLETVGALDLERYAGKWYEIARMPNRFEAECFGTTATYEPDGGGGLRVINRCHRAGRLSEVEGRARPRDTGRLRVSFGFLRSGDYNVLKVEDDYRYALVGTRARDQAWILARTPSLPGPVRARFLAELRRQGFDPDRLLWTEHPLEVTAEEPWPHLDEGVPI
jgi:apolipoprotein D and lipocalin family protein